MRLRPVRHGMTCPDSPTSAHCVEHLRPTRLTAPHDDVALMAATAKSSDANPHETALVIARDVYDRITCQGGMVRGGMVRI
jgi:hypothetical protein